MTGLGYKIMELADQGDMSDDMWPCIAFLYKSGYRNLCLLARRFVRLSVGCLMRLTHVIEAVSAFQGQSNLLQGTQLAEVPIINTVVVPARHMSMHGTSRSGGLPFYLHEVH